MANTGRGQGVSFTDKLRKVEDALDQIRDQFLHRMAEVIVRESPVWSGEYIMNHSVGEQSASGQFLGALSTGGYGPKQDREAYQAMALDKLSTQIEALPKDQTRVSISNNTPHAQIVEFGGGNTGAYLVYHTAREMAPIILEEVKAELMGNL